MKRIHAIWVRESSSVFWTVEFLSGMSILLYAMLSSVATPGSDLVVAPDDHVFSHLTRPAYWIAVLMVIGSAQLVCALRRDPLCTILTAYPASVACLFAGVYGCVVAHAVMPTAVFSIAWGILNYAVVKHSWTKAKGQTSG